MALTWKDLITTLLAGGAAWMYFANLNNTGGYRIPILVLAILGIAMCAFSGGGAGGNTAFVGVASVFGAVALILIIYGLITGAKIAFVLLAGIIMLLWVIATFRHAIGA